MTEISDEKLEAFIAGNLPESEAVEIEAMLNENPDLCVRVHSLSSKTNQVLSDKVNTAIDGILEKDVPAEIIDMLQQPETVVPINAAQNPKTTRRLLFQPFAIAASLAVIVMASVFFLQPQSSSASLPEHTLTALNTMADGAKSNTTEIGDSYLDSNGVFCRSFQLNDGVKQVGLACKPEANWQVIALFKVPGEAAYFPAGADSDDLLSSFIASMQPLADSEEVQYLSK